MRILPPRCQKMKDKYGDSAGAEIKKKAQRTERQVRLMKKVLGLLQYANNGFTIIY